MATSSTSLSVTTLHPFSTFNLWAGEFLAHLPEADREPTADPDGDKLSNLLEYALLTDPTTPDGSPFRIEPAVGGADTITLIFPWNSGS